MSFLCLFCIKYIRDVKHIFLIEMFELEDYNSGAIHDGFLNKYAVSCWFRQGCSDLPLFFRWFYFQFFSFLFYHFYCMHSFEFSLTFFFAGCSLLYLIYELPPFFIYIHFVRILCCLLKNFRNRFIYLLIYYLLFLLVKMPHDEYF